jgi:hypothetical protein
VILLYLVGFFGGEWVGEVCCRKGWGGEVREFGRRMMLGSRRDFGMGYD